MDVIDNRNDTFALAGERRQMMLLYPPDLSLEEADLVCQWLFLVGAKLKRVADRTAAGERELNTIRPEPKRGGDIAGRAPGECDAPPPRAERLIVMPVEEMAPPPTADPDRPTIFEAARREWIAGTVGSSNGTAAAGDVPLCPPVVPAPAPVPSANGGCAVVLTTAQGRADCLRLATLLAAGPRTPKGIAERLGDLSASMASYHLNRSDWFQKVPPANLKSPWMLTDAGRAALAEAGYVLVPGDTEPAPAETSPPELATKRAEPATTGPIRESVAETSPVPKRPAAKPPAPVEEPEGGRPVTPQELARRQCKAIADAIMAAEAMALTPAEIAAATDFGESVVKQRLISAGPHAPLMFRYFAKRDGGWGLTADGVALARGKG